MKSRRSSRGLRALAFSSLVACSVGASAQFGNFSWLGACLDPENMMPYSDPYGVSSLANNLIRIVIGRVGTVTYGGDTGPCYAPARTLPVNGRFAFGVGPIGSVQTDFDDDMGLTTGYPRDPAGSFTYAQIDKGLGDDGSSNRALFAVQGFFIGASNRYFVANFRDADVECRLTVRIIGDAARMHWALTNVAAQQRSLGLRWGSYVGMLTSDFKTDHTGNNQANSLLQTWYGLDPDQDGVGGKMTPEGYVGWNILPTTKPLRTERNYLRTNPRFPANAQFMFGQTSAYGTRVDNTPDSIKDQTPVDQFLVGNFGDFQAPGLLRNNEGGEENFLRNRVFTDFGRGDPLLDPTADPPLEEADILLSEVAYVQVWAPIPVAPGQTRNIVNYIRSTWSNADYEDPYTALVDAPRLVAASIDQGLNDLEPNPFRLVLYIDNQYAQIDKDIPLSNVRCTLTLGNGLNLDIGENATKTITRIAPNQIANVEWSVEADGDVNGYIPYTVRIQPTPGPTKEITGRILVAATPRMHLGSGPNLITLPWNYADTSLDDVFGLSSGRDYVAYKWDPDVNGYTPANSAERGRGLWIVPESDQGFVTLQGSTEPPDIPTGGLVVNLKRGWNLVGNPYNYAVKLSELVGVAEDNPRQSFTWQELVGLGYVGSSLAFWVRDPNQPSAGMYQFTQGAEALLQPQSGYWIYVATFRPLRIVWPPVYLVELPFSGRSTEGTWRQTDRQWRLELVARSATAIDAQNYVGVAPGDAAKQFSMPKPPRAPKQELEMSIEDRVDGRPLRMAHSFADRLARKEWKVIVTSEKEGEVTLTWPNMNSVPRNVRFRLIDTASGLARDLRMISGHTIRFEEPGSREFKVEMEPGGALRPVIGNVTVGRNGRDRSSPITVTYALSAEATTTVRVLSATGREVFVVTRGRADRVGENSATWLLRDSANRAVAPGTYRIEILAETPAGERVRKIVPVNVVR